MCKIQRSDAKERKKILYIAESTQVKWYKCLVKRKVKVKFANKQGAEEDYWKF